MRSEFPYREYFSYDIIGDIAVVKSFGFSRRKLCKAAKRLMLDHKNVKTVLAQAGPVNGEYRLRQLTHLAGEDKRETLHKENGCLFAVNLEKCYFSPRLAYERRRIASLVQPGETVVNMFSGVGCFSIIIAKHALPERVYSVDINPAAYEFMVKNIRLNRLYGKVAPLLGDSKSIVKWHLERVADRVLLPLPDKALEYLPIAISALKPEGGWIHYYDFVHARKDEIPEEKVIKRIAERSCCEKAYLSFVNSRVVRSTGPNWYQVAVDIYVDRCKA
jgi:tRNA (guanine37-N1)-methyltransferase